VGPPVVLGEGLDIRPSGVGAVGGFGEHGGFGEGGLQVWVLKLVGWWILEVVINGGERLNSEAKLRDKATSRRRNNSNAGMRDQPRDGKPSIGLLSIGGDGNGDGIVAFCSMSSERWSEWRIHSSSPLLKFHLLSSLFYLQTFEIYFILSACMTSKEDVDGTAIA
jgi:hypothetical protein